MNTEILKEFANKIKRNATNTTILKKEVDYIDYMYENEDGSCNYVTYCASELEDDDLHWIEDYLGEDLYKVLNGNALTIKYENEEFEDWYVKVF